MRLAARSRRCRLASLLTFTLVAAGACDAAATPVRPATVGVIGRIVASPTTILGSPPNVVTPAPSSADVTTATSTTTPGAPPTSLPVDVAAPPASMPPPTGRGTWAVVVGVDDYPGAGRDLGAAVADADEIAATLLALGTPGLQILVLRNTSATAPAIDAALDWLAAHAGPDAVAVVAFAGHVRSKGGGTEAMVGSDDGEVTDATLGQHLARLRARRTWLLVAGCYAAGFDDALPPGGVLTAAAPADRLAYESRDLGHSFVVEYVVRRALHRGGAGPDVQSATRWAMDRLAIEHPDRQIVQVEHQPTGPLDLRPSPVAPPAPPPERSSPPSTTAPAPSTTSTTRCLGRPIAICG